MLEATVPDLALHPLQNLMQSAAHSCAIVLIQGERYSTRDVTEWKDRHLQHVGVVYGDIFVLCPCYVFYKQYNSIFYWHLDVIVKKKEGTSQSKTKQIKLHRQFRDEK